MGVVIKSFGHCVPETAISNKELAQRFGITEEYIVEKTGIYERKYMTEGATSDMIVKAAHHCLQQTDVSPKDIDCVLVATMTPDYHCPSTASVVHSKLGTYNAAGFDVMASCSGYIYGLQIAASLINTGTYKNILVCGADKFSSIIDPSDRKTVLVFADGAGVSLLQHTETANDVIDTVCRVDSTYYSEVIQRTGGSKTPVTETNISEKKHFLRFEASKRISPFGTELFLRAMTEILKKNNLTYNDIDYIVPHQANKRILEGLAAQLNLPVNKFIINIENTGNTSAASIPIALSDALQKGKLKGNELVLVASVGAGFTYAAGLIKLNVAKGKGN